MMGPIFCLLAGLEPELLKTVICDTLDLCALYTISNVYVGNDWRKACCLDFYFYLCTRIRMNATKLLTLSKLRTT